MLLCPVYYNVYNFFDAVYSLVSRRWGRGKNCYWMAWHCVNEKNQFANNKNIWRKYESDAAESGILTLIVRCLRLKTCLSLLLTNLKRTKSFKNKFCKMQTFEPLFHLRNQNLFFLLLSFYHPTTKRNTFYELFIIWFEPSRSRISVKFLGK